MQQSLYFQTEQPDVYQDTHSNITSPDRAVFASMMSCKYILCSLGHKSDLSIKKYDATHLRLHSYCFHNLDIAFCYLKVLKPLCVVKYYKNYCVVGVVLSKIKNRQIEKILLFVP